MIQLLNEIFIDNGFGAESLDNGQIHFYVQKQNDKSEYFMVKEIEIKENESTSDFLRQVNDFVNRYSLEEEDYSVKKEIEEITKDEDKELQRYIKLSDINKNMSVIFLAKIDGLEKYYDLQQAIFSVEESTDYFKRYVLLYTNEQYEELFETASFTNYKDRLYEVINDDSLYDETLKGRYNSEYPLVLRLYSKIPFLKYHIDNSKGMDSLEYFFEKNMSEFSQKYSLDFHNQIDKEFDLNEAVAIIDDEAVKNLVEADLKTLKGELENDSKE